MFCLRAERSAISVFQPQADADCTAAEYVRQPLVANQIQFSIPVSNLVANGMESTWRLRVLSITMEVCWITAVFTTLRFRHGRRSRCHHEGMFSWKRRVPGTEPENLVHWPKNTASVIPQLRSVDFAPPGKYAACHRYGKRKPPERDYRGIQYYADAGRMV